MKCKYRFSVQGRVKPNKNMPIPTRGYVFEFKVDEKSNIITHIEITVSISDESQWPVCKKSDEPGISLDVNIKTPHFTWLQYELRTLQGLLGVFGMQSIDVENPSLEWIPESDEERKKLTLSKYSVRSERISDEEIPVLSFDLLARSVLVTSAAQKIEVPLNFYRRGAIDLVERNYIEAIYDFYFVLESEFGEGKFKTNTVINLFTSSDRLMSCVKEAKDGIPDNPISGKVKDALIEKYGRIGERECIEAIISLRGFLHHYTDKRKENWHPDIQSEYEVDAVFLQMVTYNVVFGLIGDYLWDPKIVNQYEDMERIFHRDLARKSTS